MFCSRGHWHSTFLGKEVEGDWSEKESEESEEEVDTEVEPKEATEEGAGEVAEK